jgi:hypothetical protein
MTKQELMDLVLSETELRNCDPALPQPLFDKLREMGIEPYGRFVMMYTDNSMGTLVDLFERFYHMYQEAPKLLDASVEVLHQCENREEAYDESKEGNVYIEEFASLRLWIDTMRENINTHKQ